MQVAIASGALLLGGWMLTGRSRRVHRDRIGDRAKASALRCRFL